MQPVSNPLGFGNTNMGMGMGNFWGGPDFNPMQMQQFMFNPFNPIGMWHGLE